MCVCVCVCRRQHHVTAAAFPEQSHHITSQAATPDTNYKYKKALLASGKDDKHQYENTLQTHTQTQHTNPTGAPPSPQLMNSSVDLNKI